VNGVPGHELVGGGLDESREGGWEGGREDGRKGGKEAISVSCSPRDRSID
jgi:hypothetical protein